MLFTPTSPPSSNTTILRSQLTTTDMAEALDLVTPLQLSTSPVRSKNDGRQTLSLAEASFIPLSVRNEVKELNALPVAPSSDIVEAAVLMADISGFSRLSETLRNEFGDSKGVGLICSLIPNTAAIEYVLTFYSLIHSIFFIVIFFIVIFFIVIG